MNEELLTPAEVAELCHVCSRTVLRAIRSGRLRASRLGAGAAYRIRPADVDAWIEASTVEPEPAPVTSASRTARPPRPRGRLELRDSMGRR